jgi:hypothetical protein
VSVRSCVPFAGGSAGARPAGRALGPAVPRRAPRPALGERGRGRERRRACE